MDFGITSIKLPQDALAFFLQRIFLTTVVSALAQDELVNNAQKRFSGQLLLRNLHQHPTLADFGHINTMVVGLQ